GVDEAGRGPLAGPVVAAACILPPGFQMKGVNDSKKLNEERREELYLKLIRTPGLFYAVVPVDALTIDRINIRQATLLAMRRALRNLPNRLDFALIDGNDAPDAALSCETIVEGDAKSLSIPCASILEKVTRDWIMPPHPRLFPQFGFDRHKG